MAQPSTGAHKSGTDTAKRMMALNPMGETALKPWFDMGLESLKFASSGLQKCVETQKAMLACKSLEEFQKVQKDFYASALEDYLAQVTRMMGNFTSTKVEGLGAALPSTKRSYDDVPL